MSEVYTSSAQDQTSGILLTASLSAVAPLRLVSPGAATDGVETLFFLK